MIDHTEPVTNARPDQSLVWIKNTPREDLLLKIESCKTNNLSAKQLKDLEEMEKAFVWLFVKLVEKFIGISYDQLKKFEEPQLLELAQMVAEMARPQAWMGKIFSVTIIGTLIMAACAYNPFHHPRKAFSCWNYLWLKKNIEILHGGKYFPLATLMDSSVVVLEYWQLKYLR